MTPDGRTESTAEAMALLKRTRASQLAIARATAKELIIETGKPTYTRAVKDRMVERGVFDHTIPQYWMGAMFNNVLFEWSGEYYQIPAQPGDATRNIHDRKAEKTWVLA